MDKHKEYLLRGLLRKTKEPLFSQQHKNLQNLKGLRI